MKVLFHSHSHSMRGGAARSLLELLSSLLRGQLIPIVVVPQRGEFSAECEKLGITIGPITSMKDIDEDLHYRERGSIIEIVDPVSGIPLKIPNLPFRMSDTPGRIRFMGLPQGSANSVIMSDLLGYSSEEVRRFKENSVI